ncbi:MAG: PD40 domain-containing protein [Acidobacteria bacterium]|nr:PD40 domain-containing protein [Acidobacteriota bacterium]
MRTRNTRGTSTPVGVALLALVLFFGTGLDALAQTPYVPYFGKNRIRYDDFRWKIYTTDHFEIYYYPEIEKHLERVASYAESAYQQVSADLKHDLAHKVPMVLYKTQSEFQQQNIEPTELPEGVLAFAEPYRDRMVMPIDEPSDALYRLITHELTHIFEFDIIPRSLLRRGLPLWVDEGLSDHMTGYWNPFDLMTVRDAAISDNIPAMSDFQGQAFVDGRLPYNLGHAAFEFIESRWGKEGLRQFLFALRKAVIGGGESAYEEAFKLKAEEFDEQFEKYLKDRFKPFRDKERPADYGRDLAPKRNKTPYAVVVSIEPSPSGEMMAVAAGNRKDQELDIVLMSTKDSKVVHNLTSGFNKDRGYEYIVTPGGFRNNAVPWMSWAPGGDRIAYFVRTEKHKTLILQNVVTRRVDKRVELKSVDMPESPDISPDGRHVAFSALSGAIGDIFLVDVETGDLKNVTNDQFGDYAPTFSLDGKSLVYLARVSGNDKLFTLDLATGKKTQLTFGTHDDGGAQFMDANTIVFSSTATDPNQPIDAEMARNGNIYNIWTLNLKNGELRQFTDALTANVSPVVLNDGKTPRIAFVTYYKGEYGIHTLARDQALHTVATSDFGAPGPVIDFQPPLTHTLIQNNMRTKGTFEKLFLEGRPPVNVGVTSGGDLFGGTQVTFTDVLGDKQFNLFAASVSQYRTMSFSYINLSRRLQYALQAFSQTQFYYGYQPGLLYDNQYAYLDRDQAVATQTARGATAFGIYPLNRYARFQASAGLLQFQQRYNEAGLQDLADEFQQAQYGRTLFNSGNFMPLGLEYIQETTVFREYGPLAGNTVRLGYEYAPAFGNLLSRQTAELDARYYMRIATNGVLALRARGFKSWGEFPGYLYFGGNSELRGYDYLEFLGNKAFFTNAELRFPLIEAALTPLGVVGGLRGVFFANFGASGYEGVPMKVATSKPVEYTPLLGFEQDLTTLVGIRPVFGPTQSIPGFKLVDGRASYGIGLETFALGFPIHFDWSWRTLFNRDYEDFVFAYQGLLEDKTGSEWFRKPRFAMWIGYDF